MLVISYPLQRFYNLPSFPNSTLLSTNKSKPKCSDPQNAVVYYQFLCEKVDKHLYVNHHREPREALPKYICYTDAHLDGLLSKGKAHVVQSCTQTVYSERKPDLVHTSFISRSSSTLVEITPVIGLISNSSFTLLPVNSEKR